MPEICDDILLLPMDTSKFEVVVGAGVCEKSHLNQKCRKFHEMDKSTKFFFHCLAHLDLENFLIKVWGGGGGAGVSGARPPPQHHHP